MRNQQLYRRSTGVTIVFLFAFAAIFCHMYCTSFYPDNRSETTLLLQSWYNRGSEGRPMLYSIVSTTTTNTEEKTEMSIQNFNRNLDLWTMRTKMSSESTRAPCSEVIDSSHLGHRLTVVVGLWIVAGNRKHKPRFFYDRFANVLQILSKQDWDISLQIGSQRAHNIAKKVLQNESNVQFNVKRIEVDNLPYKVYSISRPVSAHSH